MSTLKTLIRFNYQDGVDPQGGLIPDATGNLFGTTVKGGKYGYGTVFEIPYTGGNYASTPTILFSFNYKNGAYSHAGLIADAAGNLFGTTAGGALYYGTVFEVAKTAGGYASTPTTLVSFNDTNGSYPYAALIADAAGNLFGTTYQGGTYGDGTVFEVAKTAGGYASTPTTLISFDGKAGAQPNGSLIFDAAGNLFGTAVSGGETGDGTVFEIAKTGGGHAKEPILLVSFNGTNGRDPTGSLIADAVGNLFGTTALGGANGYGTVFEITKTAGHYASTPTTLVSFNGTNGQSPTGSLIADGAGNLFGMTYAGGAYGYGPYGNGYGTVFEIAKTAGGYASTPTTVLNFTDSPDGANPLGGLIADTAGNLFGTTTLGGANGGGTVFELSDTGFIVPCYLRGTKIATPTGERPVENLAQGDLVLTACGKARPIVWIGAREIDCARHRRDLYVSPDHAMLLDGNLIPARLLCNGATIRQQSVRHVQYFHVELENHDILLAEGATAESYLDTGNRRMFVSGDPSLLLHPELIEANEQVRREAGSCKPLTTVPDQVEPIWQRLAARAEASGYAVSLPAAIADPELRLSAGGREMEPVVANEGKFIFVLPPLTDEVQFLSRAASPSDLRPWLDDRRRLGVSVGRIVLRGELEFAEVPVDSPLLMDGWYDVERDSARMSRWTDGCARLLVPIGTQMIEIHLTGSTEYPAEMVAGARRLVA